MDFVRAPFAVLLSLLLCFPAPLALAQSPAADESAASQDRPAYRSTQLQGDARILQALDRFTFGPTPGEVESVRTQGLDKWFSEQLHPKTIDEAALFTRLQQFPTMQMRVEDLVTRYPSNGMIRMAMNGRVQLPNDPTERAIYENAMYRTRERQQGRANGEAKPGRRAKNALANNAGNEMNAAPAMDQSANETQADQPAAVQPAMDQPAATGALAQAEQMDARDTADGAEAAPDGALIREILALPPEQRVTRLASIREPDFDALVKSLRPVQRAALVAGMTPQQREQVEALTGSERMVGEELLSQRLMCDIYSKAQLLEVMTDFWLNHFNIYLRKDPQMPYYLVSYERDTIRPYALGRFEDLLEAVAHSPAMLMYLDNAESVGAHSLAAERFERTAWRRPNRKRQVPPGINENYGRELMELHTVGVNGGYTQADVIEASKVLTGWTVDRPQFGGGFVFNPNRHEPGTKTVMSMKIKQNGEKEGEELLHMLAMQPATARMLARELAVRFVSDNPPQALVDRMAKTYLATGGNISAVMETLFHSPELWVTTDYHAKVKTPLEYVVSAVRASGADVTNYRPLINALRVMGMPVYGCVQPNGYSWTADAWVNTGDLVDRMNFALALAANRFPGIKVSWQAAAASDSATDGAPDAASEEARLEPLLLPGGASATTRAAALKEFERQNAQGESGMQPVPEMPPRNRRMPPNLREREDSLLAGLLIGSPDFQRR